MDYENRQILRKQLYEASLRIGNESEKFVEELLLEFNEKNKLPSWLLGWNFHEKWSWHDINGVDLTIYTDIGEVLINIKSSSHFIKRFIKRHGENNIAIFIVKPSEKRGEAFHRLLETIKKRHWKMSQGLVQITAE